MKLVYIVKFDIGNGYRCHCCSQSWEDECMVSIETSEQEEFFQKKSNHEKVFPELAEVIFLKGCQKIKDVDTHGNEFFGTFTVEYTYYNEDVESDVTFQFEDDRFDEFELQKRWKDSGERLKAEKETKRKEDDLKRERQEYERLQQKFQKP